MLSKAQIEQFYAQGFLVLEDVLTEAELTAVRAEYAARMDELYDGWYNEGLVDSPPKGLDFWQKLDQCTHAASANGLDWYQPLDISLPHADITKDTPMHHGPAIFNIIRSPRILDIVECFLGGEITSNPIQHVRIKPPQRKVNMGEVRAHIISTDWHQDRGVGAPEADETDIITVWIAITDATLANGCLQAMPGPRDEILPHCPKTQTAIADGVLDTRDAVPLPVRAGGIVLLHPMTPHASQANESDHYRWSFDLRYNITGQETGRAHFPDFIARSNTNPRQEMTDWRIWKDMWEEARLRAATGPHIEQHRWRADSPYCA